MKRLVCFFIVLTMILGMTTMAFGEGAEKSLVEVVDGMSAQKQKVYAINLLVEGKDVPTDVPPMLYTINNSSRTLVPIRFIAENLGAEVKWNQDAREATIKTVDKEIVLKSDDATASVNGKSVAVPDNVPAKLLGYKGNYRTMVPLRFISEQLGMNVGWIQETATATVDLPAPPAHSSITGIDYESSQIKIKTTEKVDFSTSYLQGSKYGGDDRLVLDITDTNLKIEDQTFLLDNGIYTKNIQANGIKDIRASIFEKDPKYITRIVIDLEKQKAYDVQFDEQTNEIKIRFLNNISDIEVKKGSNKNTVVIQTAEKPIYKVIMSLEDKVVVDIINAQFTLNKDQIAVGYGGIDQIRTGMPDIHYDKDDQVARIVLDLEKGQNKEDISIEDEENNILVYVKSNPKEPVDNNKPPITPIPSGKKVIVLDAGHGGKDPGACNESLGIQEKNLALDTTLKLEKLLNNAGFNTYLTRDHDTFVDLYERANIANRLNADAFVSIHYNSATSTSAKGIQVLYKGGDSTRDNKKFASIVQEELLEKLNAVDRKIVDRPNLVVLKQTNMPAILAELGFISNDQEGSLAATDAYQQDCAEALFDGIVRFFNEVLK